MPPKTRNTTWKKQIIEKQVPCRECGSPTPSKSTYAVCDECKILLHRHRQRHFLKNMHYQVIYDPDQEWGYRNTAVFSVTELNIMRQSVNQPSLTPGTILKRGNQYFIIEPPDGHYGNQKLVPLDAPALDLKLQHA